MTKNGLDFWSKLGNDGQNFIIKLNEGHWSERLLLIHQQITCLILNLNDQKSFQSNLIIAYKLNLS